MLYREQYLGKGLIGFTISCISLKSSQKEGVSNQKRVTYDVSVKERERER
jgi:hypothetical protein